MRYFFYLFISLLLFSCSNPSPCVDIEYTGGLTYKNGVLYTGRCSVVKDDSIVSIQQYLSGRDHGNWVFYHSNGEIETKGKFKNGKRIGKWKYYHDNGNLKQISFYKDGEKSGIWSTYDYDGNLIKEIKIQ